MLNNSAQTIRAVTSIGQTGLIRGYLAIWGSPDRTDCYGTYFDRSNPPEMGLEFLPVPLFYAHGRDPEIGISPVGKVYRTATDDKGISFEAQLDPAHPAYPRIVREIAGGDLSTSSGSAQHLAQFDADGRFDKWFLSELSLTREPCEFNMPSVAVIRSKLGVTPEPIKSSTTNAGGDSLGGCGCESDTGSTQVTGAIFSKQASAIRGSKMATTMDQLGLDPNTNPGDVLGALIGQFGYNGVMQALMALNQQEESAEGQSPVTSSAPAAAMPAAAAPGRSFDLAALMVQLAKQGNQSVTREVAPATQAAPVNSEIAALRSDIQALKSALLAAPASPAQSAPVRDNRAPASGPDSRLKIGEIRDNRFDSVSTRDLVYAANALMSGTTKNPVISADLQKALAYKVADEIERGKSEVGNDYALRMAFPYRNRDDVMASSFSAIRANEVMGTTNSGLGSNWVGSYYETDLWLTVRQTPIWQMLESRGMTIREVPQGYNNDTIPVEGLDPTWYKVGETLNIDSTNRPSIGITPSQEGTTSKNMTFAKIGALIFYSGEQTEDGLIAIASEIRRKMTITAREKIEYVLLNGDTVTAATANINLIDGTPTAGTLYLTLDGILKSALLGNSGAQARDQGGTLSVLAYRKLMSKLGPNGIAGNDPSKLMFITDVPSYLATFDLPELKTKDVSSFATLESGNLSRIYGIDLFRSGQLGLANAAGKISATPANNTQGRIILTRPDQLALGWKRQVTMEPVRYAESDANGIVTFMRLGFVTRNDQYANAVSYNVTV